MKKAITSKSKWFEDQEGNWISFQVSAKEAADIKTAMLEGRKYSLCIKEYRSGRSLDANAYYHVLLTELAEKLNVSSSYLHNIMLRRYGQPEIINGNMVYVVVPDTLEAERKADEEEKFHIKPTSNVRPGKSGEMLRTYVLIRGSSSYNTKEMSVLIDGLISECKECGIDTAPVKDVYYQGELLYAKA